MNDSEIREGTELVIICSHCGVLLKEPEAWQQGTDKTAQVRTSHGICPDCLLENYPQQYLNIQRKWRIRIKNEYKNGYPDLAKKIKRGK